MLENCSKQAISQPEQGSETKHKIKQKLKASAFMQHKGMMQIAGEMRK